MFAAKKQETVLEAQTRALNVPRYLFVQPIKCDYEMAWNQPKHEFKTEILDWACSLRHNKKWFWRHKLVYLMHLISVFAGIKECLELLVNFMNKISIHNTFKTIIC